MKKTAKTEKIIDCALLLLKTEGDYGVTMRQVAVRADMSLSNVQYYFKNKDELLKAMADRYFQACLDDIRSIESIQPVDDIKRALSAMLKEFLAHGLEISEMCRIFREYWAIATRNPVIESYLKNYYASLSEVLSEKLQPVAANDKALEKATSVIIPFVEGYTITAPALSKDIHEVNEMLTDIVCGLLVESD